MSTEHLISDLWKAASEGRPDAADSAAGRLFVAVATLGNLLAQLDRLAHGVAEGQPVGVAIMLTEAERDMLVEAVGRMATDKNAVIHGRSRMPDAGVNEAAEEARLLLALRARLEALHG